VELLLMLMLMMLMLVELQMGSWRAAAAIDDGRLR